MYVDPLTLFILGEFLVVYIIINIFLFYNGRLYKVLVALLKEWRFERLRRQQEKQKEIAALRATNKGLLSKNESLEASVQSAGKTIPEQLEERIHALEEKYPQAHDLQNSVEMDESIQWLRMRILELEKELLSGNITEDRWQEMAVEAISRMQISEAEEKANIENRKESAEDSRYTGQLQNDLEEATRLYQDAKIRIRQLEGELEDIKSINTPTENPLETPKRGLYEDEIYRLKCDNFDLHESINKLKLELQQIDPAAAEDAYVALLENQVSNMEQYIKSADIAQGLMEKEISAAQAQIDDLENQLSKLGNAPSTVDLSSLNSLSEQHEAKSDTLNSIKETVDRLKNGESSETIAAEQEAHIARLEQIIRESQQCINILESELSQSSKDIRELQDELANKKTELLSAKLGGLNDTQNQQKEGVGNIKGIINDIRGGSDLEENLTRQEQEIEKLERFLTESDTLIAQLESEIEDLNQKLQQLPEGDSSSEESTRPSSDEDIQEMEALLQQFIRDIQWLMKSINKLEDENAALKSSMESMNQQSHRANPEAENKFNDSGEHSERLDTFDESDPLAALTEEPDISDEEHLENLANEAEPPVMIDIEEDYNDNPQNPSS